MSERSGTVLRRGGAVAFAVLLALTVAACQPVRAHLTASSSTSAPPSATETQIIAAVNKFRAAHGLRALSAEWNLEDKAHLWSAWMAGGHCGRNANGVPKICHSNLTSGITVNWSLIEENVGAASPKTNIAGIVSGFEHSPEHAANMLNKRITAIGVGVAYSGNAVFVAEEFMAQ
jgi:uncharacterized protein YkwD